MRPDSGNKGHKSDSNQYPPYLTADGLPHTSGQEATSRTLSALNQPDIVAGHGHVRRANPSGYLSEFRPISKASSASDRVSAYKRARTVSPVIDDFSSDVEQEVRSIYSGSNSDIGEIDSGDPPLSLLQQQFPTPLRESISSADVSESIDTAMLPPDHAIEALMKGKSLSLDDQATKAARETTSNGDELPSYQQTLPEPSVQLVKPSGKEQLDLIRPMKNRPLHAGDIWYLIGRGWYRRWSAACSGQLILEDDEQEDPIGPIDSTPLLDEGSSPAQALLKARITEHMDYELVPQEGWSLLTQWYGIKGPVFARNVIEGLQPGNESIEFYPPIIRLLKLVGQGSTRGLGVPSFSLSVSSPIAELKARAKTAFELGSIPDSDVRLWFIPEPTDDELGSGLVSIARTTSEGVQSIDAGEDRPASYNPAVTLKTVGIDEIEVVLAVETRSSGSWLSTPVEVLERPAPSQSTKNIFAQQNGDFFSNLQQSGSSTSSSTASSEAQGRVTRSQSAMDRTFGRSRGLRGLNNLGNTCFMNSALQCMSNTYELQQYFVSGVYREELNADNPLGMGGAIAEAFGSLITNLWNGQGGSFWPRDFKFALSRFAPQFSGYAQHDSQELLAFLLDGLHEDLNRILKKPYIEAPDWEGGNERELVTFAKRQWDIYKARNDSVIVDLFQGQYRSTLVCPQCNKVSIKFDPFMYLTLPIPNKKMWKGHVYFVPLATEKATQKFQVQLPAGSSVSHLRQKVAAHFHVDNKHLICGEVWHRELYKWWDDYDPVIDIKASDYVYFWEVASPARLPASHRQPSYRHYRSIEEVEARREPIEDDHAVLPVYTSQVSNSTGSSSRHAYAGRRAKPDTLGIPFFITIPQRDINNVEAVRRAVLDGYVRFAKDKHVLATVAHAASNVSEYGNTQAPISEWEMVDQGSRSEHAVEIVTSDKTPSDAMVTEFREDGEAVVVPDLHLSEQFDPETTIMVENADASDEQGDALPEFTIRFGVSENGSEIPKGVSDSSETLSEELFERFTRLSKPMQAGVDALSGDVEADGKARSLQKPLPLVYTGGALFCSWSLRTFADKLFVESESGQMWGPHEDVLDEALRHEDSVGTAKIKSLSIEDCMDEFTKEEQLGEDDPWFCPSCKEFRQATKKFDLWKVPDILVVHLKRFSAGRHSRDKLNVMVDFPLEGLDLTKRVEGVKAVRRVQTEAEENGEELSESMLGSGILRPLEDNDDAVATDHPIYDLYAVDNHFGGLGGGHYTAYAKSPADGQWYNFDDSSVRPVSDPNSVRTSSAYLLFYRRRTTRPIGGKSRQKFQEANKSKLSEPSSTVLEHSHLATVTMSDDEPMGADAPTEADSLSSDSPGWLHTFRGAEPESAQGWTSSRDSPASSLRAMSPASERESTSP